jgi:predicted MFS family arabinose efflux permease
MSLGASSLELGLVMAMLSLVGVVFRIPFCHRIDKIGAWQIIRIAVALLAFSLTLYSLATSVIWLLAVTILYAFCFMLIDPAIYSISLNCAEPTGHGTRFGKVFAAIGAGMMCGPILSGMISQILGLRNAIFAVAVIFGIAFVILTLSNPRGPMHERHRYHSTNATRSFLETIGSMRSMKTAWPCILWAVFAFGTGIFITLFPVYASERLFLSTSMIGFLFAIRGMANTLTRIFAGRATDRLGAEKMANLGLILPAAAFATIVLLSDFYGLFIAMLLYGIGWGILIVALATQLSDNILAEEATVASAIFYTFGDAGLVAGSLASGFLATFPAEAIFGLPAALLVATTISGTFRYKERSRYRSGCASTSFRC